MSSTANSAPRLATSPSVGATLIESSVRICTASPGSTVTAPSGPGWNGGGVGGGGGGGGTTGLSLHADMARMAISAAVDVRICLRIGPAPSQSCIVRQ